MFLQAALMTATLTLAAPPATRIAVLVDDPGQGTPALAAIEAKLQGLGYEVVAAETSARMREVVAPKDVLSSRLPDGLSVFEADALLGGTVAYGTPMEIEGVQSVPVSLTALEYRLLAFLAHRRDQVVSPTTLLEHLYGDDDAREVNALEALVARLRRKLGPGIVGTRRGFGYYLQGTNA